MDTEQDMAQIEAAALALPWATRKELADRLMRSLAEERDEDNYRFLERGADIIRDTFGRDIRQRSRERDLVDLRTVYCYRMRQEGIYLRVIGAYLNLDHSTVQFHVTKMNDAFKYPKAFPGLVKKYNTFNQAI